MPSISLGDLKNLWQKVSDWVDGLYQPQVKILGTDGTTQRQVKTNANGELIVSLPAGSAINHGLVSVATPGTKVQLPNVPCIEVTVVARKGNTGSIFAGGNGVSATSFGVELSADGSYTFKVSNANMIYIDSSVGGEGISYVAV